MDRYRDRNVLPKKKYNLSLKNRNQFKAHDFVNPSFNITNDSSEAGDSQDFKLRISDSFHFDDSLERSRPAKTYQNIQKPKRSNEIIIISDSSDEDHPPDILMTNNNNKKPQLIDQGSIEVSDEDDSIFTGSLTRKKSSGSSGSNPKSTDSNGINTSDGTNFELKIEHKDTDLESVVDNSYTTPISKIRHTPQTVITASKLPDKPETPTTVLSTVTKKIGTPGSTKLSQCTTPLSKKEAKKIMKVIRSKRMESPVVANKNQIIAETDSDSVVTDEEPDGKLMHPAWIDDSDIETSSIPLYPPKPSKTHVSRFLNPATVDVLSDEKHRDISRWIMNNPTQDRSDDSISNISASNQDSSINSGHRSLERLEVNYETPNNRQKFRDTISGRSTKTQNSGVNPLEISRSVQNGTPAQTLMDDYLKKTKDCRIRNYTPIAIKSKIAVEPVAETPKAELEDCADILDKLYGVTWRTTPVLPTSEPRKRVELKDRGVQTDCIRKTKKFFDSDNSSNDGSNKKAPKDVLKDVNHNKKGPKKLFSNSDNSSNDEGLSKLPKALPKDLKSSKKVQKNYKYRDSFIVGSSESEASTGDTTYMTALTNPIPGKNCPRIENLMTLNTRKAIEICDSDSEVDTPIGTNDNRKKLVYSDDERDQSSATSEYDPDDFLPPKPVLPKVKPLVNNSKIPTRLPPPQSRHQSALPKSFLASLSGSVPIENCHQDAKRYRLSFKTTKEDLVKVLYKMFNEKIFENKLPPDMLIEWNVRMRGTAGFCYNKKVTGVRGITRSSRIALATKILDKPDRLRDTLVHEMCHAAAWLINEVADGHGPFWKSWSVKAMKAFPELPPIKRCHDYEIATKFTYRCTQCGYSIGRHSKSLDTTKKRCGLCYGHFELLLNRVTKSGTMKQIPKTPNARQPSAFALFVKENYSTIKKAQKGRPHKEVMQLLGQQFSAIKLSKQNDNGRQSPGDST